MVIFKVNDSDQGHEMNPAKPNVRDIFAQALEIEADDHRSAFLDQACQGDQEVRQKVEDLIAANADAGKFMNGTGMCPATTGGDVAEAPGDCIGPYKLREKIGEGGFGVVYVAEQERPVSRKVALKIIKPGMDTKDIIARFEAERQALAMMNHPNVARILDAGATESGRPYFVMELVHGIPLTDFCDEQSLSNRQRLELFIEVCRAVQHAHQKGIIHRDLKPSNIMVTLHDDKPVPKVIDFGVAKALSQKLTEKTVYTSYGQMIGTPLYMSPEQAQMSGLDLDTRSDVYSLGVLMYELLTGTTPFDKETLKNADYDELRRMIREDDPPIPSARVSTLRGEILSTAADRRKIDQRKLCESLRGELDWIVMQAMEKNRSRRYQSASELAADVQSYLNDEPVTACPPSIGYRFGKFARRNKAVLTSSALIALALIIGTIASTWQAVLASDAQANADDQKNAAVQAAALAEESEREARRNETLARQERDNAVAAREELRRVLYASELNLLQAAWDIDNYGRVSQLLDNTRPQPGETDIRGFEWHYWNRQLNGPLESRSVAIPEVGKRKLLELLSPDGTKLAVQYYDEDKISVAIWDVTTASELCHFELSPGTIGSTGTRMVFSPDGTRLAIAARRTGNLIIRDTRTGERLARIEDDETVYRFRFSHDGNRVVYTYGTTKEKRLPSDYGYRVWDLATDRIVFSHRYAGELFAGFVFLSPDGRQMGMTRGKGRQPTHLQVWDVETAKVLQDRAFDDGFLFRALSPDGSRVALQNTSAPHQLMVLDTQSLDTILQGQPCHQAAFSPDGSFLATSNDTRNVSIWSLQHLSNANVEEPTQVTPPLFMLPVPQSGAELRFSSDGRQLHSRLRSRVKSWTVPLQLMSSAPQTWSGGVVIGGSFNSDCTRAVLRAEPAKSNQPTLLLSWDVEADRELWRYRDARDERAFGNPVFTDGRFVVVPSGKARTTRLENPTEFHDELLVLDGDTGSVVRSFKKAAYGIDDIVFDPRGTHVAAIVRSKPAGKPHKVEVVLWNVVTGKEVFAVNVEDDDPNLAGFSRDGRELMLGQRASGGVLVLDSLTGASRRVIAPDGTALNQVGKWSLSPDGRTLAVLGLRDHAHDVAVAFYDAATGEPGRRIPVDTKHAPLAMTWSSDSRRLALASANWVTTDVTIWDTATGRLVLTLNRKGLVNHDHGSLRFSPDNQRLLHITGDNFVPQAGSYNKPSLHPIHIWNGTPIPTRND